MRSLQTPAHFVFSLLAHSVGDTHRALLHTFLTAASRSLNFLNGRQWHSHVVQRPYTNAGCKLLTSQKLQTGHLGRGRPASKPQSQREPRASAGMSQQRQAPSGAGSLSCIRPQLIAAPQKVTGWSAHAQMVICPKVSPEVVQVAFDPWCKFVP